MRTEARFPGIGPGSGHYESFYIKATRPGGGRAIWIRHTVHKRPGEELDRVGLVHALRRRRAGPAGDQGDRAGRPRSRRPPAPNRGRRRLARARRGDGARSSTDGARRRAGSCAFDQGPEAFRHLPYEFLYGPRCRRRSSSPPTPTPASRGSVTVDGERIELDAWPGMIGHNWGAEHAERWIWIQANELERRRRLLRRRRSAGSRSGR